MDSSFIIENTIINNNSAGGGGGSYNSGTNQDNESGVNEGHGYVIISCGN